MYHIRSPAICVTPSVPQQYLLSLLFHSSIYYPFFSTAVSFTHSVPQQYMLTLLFHCSTCYPLCSTAVHVTPCVPQQYMLPLLFHISICYPCSARGGGSRRVKMVKTLKVHYIPLSFLNHHLQFVIIFQNV